MELTKEAKELKDGIAERILRSLADGKIEILASEPTRSNVRAAVRGCLEKITTLETALHESRADADAQRQLAENYMNAFASKPDQRLADGLEEHVAMLKKELQSAREVLEEIEYGGNGYESAHKWLRNHPA